MSKGLKRASAETMFKFIRLAAKVPLAQRWADWNPPSPVIKQVDSNTSKVYFTLNDKVIATLFPSNVIEIHGLDTSRLVEDINDVSKGLGLNDLDLRYMRFQSCDLTDVNFTFSSFGSPSPYPWFSAEFTECNLAHADFSSANFRHFTFHSCRYDRTKFESAKLSYCHFNPGDQDDPVLSISLDNRSELNTVLIDGNYRLPSTLSQAKMHYVHTIMEESTDRSFNEIRSLPGHRLTWGEETQDELTNLLHLAFGLDNLNLEFERYLLMDPGYESLRYACMAEHSNEKRRDYPEEVAKALWTILYPQIQGVKPEVQFQTIADVVAPISLRIAEELVRQNLVELRSGIGPADLAKLLKTPVQQLINTQAQHISVDFADALLRPLEVHQIVQSIDKTLMSSPLVDEVNADDVELKDLILDVLETFSSSK